MASVIVLRHCVDKEEEKEESSLTVFLPLGVLAGDETRQQDRFADESRQPLHVVRLDARGNTRTCVCVKRAG